MYDAAECRRRAEYCVQQANEPGTSKTQQAILIGFAAQWIELAEYTEYVDSLMDVREVATQSGGRLI
jgi:hypothetical protein